MNWIFNLLNNWLVQAIIGNIVWLALCGILKKVLSSYKKHNKNNNLNNLPYKLHSKKFLNRKFSILYYCSEILIFALAFFILHDLPPKHPFIFCLIVIAVFSSQVLMFNTFEDTLKNYSNSQN